MRFTFEVNVEVERVTGRFVSRDTIGDTIREALEEAAGDVDVSDVGDDGSEYEVTDSSVDEIEQPKHSRRKTAVAVS